MREIRNGCLGTGSGDETHGADHEVGKGLVAIGVLGAVTGEVRNLVRLGSLEASRRRREVTRLTNGGESCSA